MTTTTTTVDTTNNRSPLVIMSEMQFNKLQDSVHPIANTNGGGDATSTTIKCNNDSVDDDHHYHHRPASNRINLSKATILFVLLFALALFVLALLITFWATKAVYEQQQVSNRPSDMDDVNVTDSSELTSQMSNKSLRNTAQPTAKELRLPSALLPISYNLTLKTYLPGFVAIDVNDAFTFDAQLAIQFVVIETTDRIVLSVRALNLSTNVDDYSLILVDVQQANRKRQTTTSIRVQSIVMNETVEMVTFILDGQLISGRNYIFEFRYRGPISRTVLAGLYVSQYKNMNGETRYVAITQMEPTDARRMVPCFDEPAMKAQWKITVIYPTGFRAVSNGIEESETPIRNDSNWSQTTFKETVKMSSYLLAIAVCDFGYQQNFTKRGTRFRIWARKDAHNQTAYALEAGIKSLEFFEDYYNISFPLPKQDMMAFPDFQAGAMENWGLITYREKYLLYDEQLYSLNGKLNVASVVAHEVAHQWFGNLVTMKWWDDLWLNEGFATYMSFLGTDYISDNKFKMDDYFVVYSLKSALRRDQRATSHPLFFPIEKAEDVDEGASVLRMIEHLMGSEQFKKGLNIYLNRFAYSNANNNDLWTALGEAVSDDTKSWNGDKLSIVDFAASWTEQMGYPVIEMKRIDETTIELAQKRFKLDESAKEQERFRNAKYWYKWDVPIWHEINGVEHPMVWLHTSQQIAVGVDDLLVLNPGAKGFYRVNYDRNRWARITEQLLDDHTKIDVRSRAQMFDDAFTFAEANQLDYETALNLTRYLHMETESLPWTNALDGLVTIIAYFDDEPQFEHIQKYLKSLMKPLYERYGWTNLPTTFTDDARFYHDDLQSRALSRYCALRDPDCNQHAVDMFRRKFIELCDNGTKLSSQCSRVPLTVRTLSYCKGVNYGNEADWQFVFDMYLNESVQVEKERLMVALACSREKWILKRLLDMTMEKDSKIRRQDVGLLFYSVGSTQTGSSIMFDYFIDNWQRIYQTFKDSPSLIRSIVTASTDLKLERKIKDFEEFIDQNQPVTGKLDVFEIQLEKAWSNKHWMDTHFSRLTEWFKRQNSKQKDDDTAIVNTTTLTSTIDDDDNNDLDWSTTTVANAMGDK